MILRFSPQPDSPHSQIFRKVGQKKAEPNIPSVSSFLSPLPRSYPIFTYLCPDAVEAAIHGAVVPTHARMLGGQIWKHGVLLLRIRAVPSDGAIRDPLASLRSF
jgi:hypothetical protein